jgi:hypothetical protein
MCLGMRNSMSFGDRSGRFLSGGIALVPLELSIKLFLVIFKTVIFLDWSGVDLSSNPLHPASKLFDSRSSLEL